MSILPFLVNFVHLSMGAAAAPWAPILLVNTFLLLLLLNDFDSCWLTEPDKGMSCFSASKSIVCCCFRHRCRKTASMECFPYFCFNSAGLPSSSSFPSRINPTRSACSASIKSCVVMTIVVPSLDNCSRYSQIRCRRIISIPTDGSSSNAKRGLCNNAQVRRCWPPLSLPTREEEGFPLFQHRFVHPMQLPECVQRFRN